MDQTEELNALRAFVRKIADFTKEGETDPTDPAGDTFVMMDEDNHETLCNLIDEARELAKTSENESMIQCLINESARQAAEKAERQVDVVDEYHGSISILTLKTDAAKEWVKEHIPEDAQRIGSSGLVVESRYVADIIHGMEQDGLVVE